MQSRRTCAWANGQDSVGETWQRQPTSPIHPTRDFALFVDGSEDGFARVAGSLLTRDREPLLDSAESYLKAEG